MQKLFDDIAYKLLNNATLEVKNKQYRICEIEMYYHNKDHPDEYTHKHVKQLDYNSFYPHQYKTGSYKARTYKCLDFCLGNKNTNTYFGILIRSIKNINTNEFFCGPCVCVKEILSNFNCSEFAEFFRKYSIDEFKLNEHELSEEKIYIGPRVGLSDKYPEYKNRKYRYAILIKQITKQKSFEKLNN